MAARQSSASGSSLDRQEEGSDGSETHARQGSASSVSGLWTVECGPLDGGDTGLVWKEGVAVWWGVAIVRDALRGVIQRVM